MAARRQLMMHAEKLAAELTEALDALHGEGTSGARLAAALAPHRAAGWCRARLCSRRWPRRWRGCLAETNAARAKIEEALAATAFEPKELERAEERLFALRALARKHKVQVDDLPALRAAPRNRARDARYQRDARLSSWPRRRQPPARSMHGRHRG